MRRFFYLFIVHVIVEEVRHSRKINIAGDRISFKRLLFVFATKKRITIELYIIIIIIQNKRDKKPFSKISGCFFFPGFIIDQIDFFPCLLCSCLQYNRLRFGSLPAGKKAPLLRSSDNVLNRFFSFYNHLMRVIYSPPFLPIL